MTERPTWIRYTGDPGHDLTPGRVYRVHAWYGGTPVVVDDAEDGNWLTPSKWFTWEPAPASHDASVSGPATHRETPAEELTFGPLPDAPEQHVSPTGGLRSNAGKLPMHLIPTVLPRAVAAVLGKGAEKYAPRNWERGMEFSVCYASLARHLAAYWDGEDIDAESGQPHMAHVATNAAFLLEYARRIAAGTLPASLDDRPRP